LLLELQLERG